MAHIQDVVNLLHSAIQTNKIPDLDDRNNPEEWMDAGARYVNKNPDILTNPDYYAELPELCFTFNQWLNGEITVIIP